MGEGNSFSLLVSPHLGRGGTYLGWWMGGGGTYLGQGGTYLSYLGWWMGGNPPPPSQPGQDRGYPKVGTPPRPGQNRGVPQGRYPLLEDLLHGGRYASCVHAGGLSCSLTVYTQIKRVKNLYLPQEIRPLQYPVTEGKDSLQQGKFGKQLHQYQAA